MRSSIGRLTLRGARAVASTSTRKPTFAHVQNGARDLCSSSAISPDGKHKVENETDTKDDRMSVVDMLKNEPAVQVLTDDISSSAVIVEPLSADAEASVEASQALHDADDSPIDHAQGRSMVMADGTKTLANDPKKLHERLSELLERNAIRTALWEYGSAFKTEGVPAVDMEVMKLMLPVMGRNAWATTSNDTLLLAVERGYQLPIGAYNCGFHAMCRSGKAEEIKTLMDSMWTFGPESHPNATSFNYLIAGHVYRGNVDDAFAVLNDMKTHLVYPTFTTYHALITGCLRRRDPRRAYQTLIAVEKQRFDISAMTVAQVMVASANNDDYDHVLHLLSKFEECLPRYNTELHRIAEFRGLYRMSKTERTTKGDRETLRGDPKVEIGALSTVLHSAFRGGRIDLASRAWMLMEEQYPGFEPPAPLWYCLIGAYAGAGEFAQAIDFVGIMRERGLKTSMRDLDMSLIRPLAYDVTVIDEMFFRLCDRASGKDSAKVSEETDTAVAQAAEEAIGDLAEENATDVTATVAQTAEDTMEDKAAVLPDGAEVSAENQDPAVRELVDEVPVDNGNIATEVAAHDEIESTEESSTSSQSLAEALLTPDNQNPNGFLMGERKPTSVGIDELNCIIAACSAAQDLDRAFQTYDEVETRFKIKKNIDTYNALLEGCVQTRRLAGGIRVLEEVKKEGLSVDGYTLHLACRLMLRAGRSKDVEDLLDKAHDEGDTISIQTYQMVLRQLCRAENYDVAVKLLKRAEENGFKRNALIGRFDFNMASKIRSIAYGDAPARSESEVVGGAADDVAEEDEVRQEEFRGKDREEKH